MLTLLSALALVVLLLGVLTRLAWLVLKVCLWTAFVGAWAGLLLVLYFM